MSTVTIRILRDRRSRSTPTSAGRSNTSWRHSRVVSRMIGKLGWPAATSSRPAAFCRCCHSGRALARTALGEEQGTGRGLAEPGAEQRRAGQRVDDEVLDLLGIEHEVLDGEVLDRVGQAQHDAVVAPEHLDVDAEPLAERVAQGHAPRRVHPCAERREHADPPVAELVGEALDDDGAVVGDRAGGLDLLVEVGDEVARPRARRARSRPRRCATASSVVRRAQVAGERADGPAQLDRAAGLVAVPERHLPLLAGRGEHDHAVVGDLVDAPGARAEHERLARAALVDHLLVELADARALGEEHAEQPTVGDGAAVGDRDAARRRRGRARVPRRRSHTMRGRSSANSSDG